MRRALPVVIGIKKTSWAAASPIRRPTTAFATVDFDKPGKQVGFVMIPHSPHEDAWGVTRVPVAVIANGSGPTAVIAAATTATSMKGRSSSPR